MKKSMNESQQEEFTHQFLLCLRGILQSSDIYILTLEESLSEILCKVFDNIESNNMNLIICLYHKIE